MDYIHNIQRMPTQQGSIIHDIMTPVIKGFLQVPDKKMNGFFHTLSETNNLPLKVNVWFQKGKGPSLKQHFSGETRC